MARPASFMQIGFRDYSNEPSSVEIPVTDLTAGNFTAQTGLQTALQTAIVAVTLGNVVRDMGIWRRRSNLGVAPTNPLAQREKKWLVRYHDATTFVKYQAEIPCANLTLLAPASDFMLTTATEFTDLKAAWEAVVRSPDDNNLTVLDSLQFVGRKL